MRFMKRSRLSSLVLLLFVILLLRFTGAFSFWMKEGVADVYIADNVPFLPSFSLDSFRSQVAVSSVITDFMRSEKGRQEYGMQHALPPRVKEYIDLFTTSGRKHFNRGLSKANTYSDQLGPVLNHYGLPTEMLILAYIESNFNVNARSTADAVGPWQFMKETAMRYGLRVDEHVDEREDMLKATHAAGRYLRDLVREFPSLELAVAAYNTGENRVRSAILREGSTDFWTLASKGEFSRQTVNYVAKFSAAMILTSDQGGRMSNIPL